MSDNNLSIDEIIKKAEIIKAQAEQQLKDAQKNLDEMARSAIDEVTVDSEAVMKKVEELSDEEEDIKEFVPSKSKKTSEKTITFPKFSKKKPIKTYDDSDVKEHTQIIPKSANKTKVLDSDDDEIFEKPIIPADKTRPVILTPKSENKSPDRLQEVPTIVARENLSKYLDGNDDLEEETGIQMCFEGFDDMTEEVPTIDEEEAEKLLNEQRKEKVNKFRLFGPDETDTELGDRDYEEKDYKTKDDRQAILTSLLKKKSRIGIQTIISCVLFGILLLLTVFKDTEYLPQSIAENDKFFITASVLSLLTIVVNFNIFIHGFNFKKGINSDFSVSLLSLVVSAQTIAFAAHEDLWLNNGVFLGSALAFAYILALLGKRQILIRIIDNFDFIINSGEIYCLENIANVLDVKVLCRGNVDEDDAIIKTSVKTDLPTNFMEISCKSEPSDKTARVLTPLMFLLSGLLLVIIGLKDNWSTGINTAVCALTISTPVSLLFIMNNVLTDISAELDKYGARVCGFEGAQMAASTDAIVLEASNLFGSQGCDLHGIKVFNNTKIDDAIIYAAAVIIKTKSPLAHVFDDVIIGKQSILPKVDSVQYEEQMGTSAWVYHKKVLVGNRNLLINHGVNVPKISFEQKYTRRNRKALYLAVDGKIMAMFVVSYSADPDLKRELIKLEKTGITLIVKSSDPYINEESLANLFDLPKGYIKVMNRQAARVFEKYSDMQVEKSPAYVVHNGTAKGLISSMRGALTVNGTKRIIAFLTTFGSTLGFATVATLGIVGWYSQITDAAIIVSQIVWSAFVLAVSKLRRIGF
ncbi:hypothetical protein [uncultured Eubacterium sp.]|uniref:hypothetical protein n=1 Tax=uncultured Eubacterium sp. TaxID=165185 RepID=UPI0028043C00|nr:hypothetical protein [uncultured Eubacterium sp.]